MIKLPKTIKISLHHEEWLKSNNINFSEWVRKKLDEEIDQNNKGNIYKKYKAVILAAGKDVNLFPLTEEIPKAILDIKGKTILQRQIEMLRKVGIHDIAVVRGYKKHQISYPNLKFFDNDDYDKTGTLVSLFSATEFMHSDTIVLYGDVLFNSDVLIRLMEGPANTTLIVDRGWQKKYQISHEEHPHPPELTSVSEKDRGIEIDSVGTGLPDTEYTSEFIGLAKLSVNACSILKEIKNDYIQDPEIIFQQSKHIRTSSFIDFIEELIHRKEKISGIGIWRSWIEVDTFEDYRNSWKYIDEIIGE